MRIKLLSILALLCLAVISAWADEITVTFSNPNNSSTEVKNVTSLPHTFSSGDLDQIVKKFYGNISGSLTSVEPHFSGTGNLSVSGTSLTISGNFSVAEIGCRYYAQTGPNDVVNNVYILYVSVSGAPALTSGSWTSGDCTVTLNQGVLTVSKTDPTSTTGNMANYNPTNLAWQDASAGITSIVIEDGVTHIGDYAFYSCNNESFTSVNIPSSVTSIGNYAFLACNRLATVTLNSNPSIGYNAFMGLTYMATVKMNLTANGPVDGYKWMTFYNDANDYHFRADENTTVYKAKISGNKLALTEVADKIVNSSAAVILKSSGNPVMTMVSGESSDNYSNNDLQGTMTETAKPANCYTLANGSAGVGFYLYNGEKIHAGKAYLIYTGSNARTFYGFDEDDATAIDLPAIVSDATDGDIYDLMGRKIEGQPTTKGIYVRNGQKFIIK